MHHPYSSAARLALPLLLLLLGACNASGPSSDSRVHAQRPFISRDTHTTPDKLIEIELGGQIVQGHEAEVPLTLKHGLGPQTEFFTTTSPYKEIDTNDEVVDGVQQFDGSGWGDTYVGFRHRFRDKDMFSPGYGFQMQTKLPTGRPKHGLGTGELDWFGAAMANQIYYGFDTTVFYQLGLLGEFSSTAAKANGTNVEHTLALQTRRELNANVTGFGEAAIVWEPERRREETTLMAGVSFQLDSLTALDLGVRVGVGDDAPSFQVLFGISRALGMLFFPEDDARASLRR
jgi:hypothetical protein